MASPTTGSGRPSLPRSNLALPPILGDGLKTEIGELKQRSSTLASIQDPDPIFPTDGVCRMSLVISPTWTRLGATATEAVRGLARSLA